MAPRALILGLALAGLILSASAPASAATGRASFVADLVVDDEVTGDVVAVGGNVRLGPDAKVHGHVIAVFGRVEADPQARVDGRVLAIRSLAALSLHAGAAQPPTVDLALRLLTAGGWLLVTTALAVLFPIAVRANGDLLPRLGIRVAVLGVLSVVTLIAAVIAALGLGPAVGVPLVTGLMLLFFAVKAAGLTVLGAALGAATLRRPLRRILPPSFEVLCGVALLLLVRLLPGIGAVMWNVVSVVALGSGIFALALAASSDPVALILRLGGPERH
jgi:hypothetical protein